MGLDRSKFDAADEIVKRHIGSTMELGKALLEIRDGELWRAGGFDSFRAYLQARVHQIDVSYAYRIVKAAETPRKAPKTVVPIGTTSETVKPTGPEKPETVADVAFNMDVELKESHHRALRKVPEAFRPEVLKKAVTSVERDDKGAPKLSAAAIEKAAERVAPTTEPESLARPKLNALMDQVRRLRAAVADLVSTEKIDLGDADGFLGKLLSALQHALLSLAKPVRSRTRTPRDDIWDAVVAIWFSGPAVTKREAKRVGKIVQGFVELEATPDEIKKRHNRAYTQWTEPRYATPEAVLKQWRNLTKDSDARKCGPVRAKDGKYADHS